MDRQDPKPFDQMVYSMRAHAPVSGTNLARGFIAYIGLGIADPYLMTVGGSSALSGADVIIVDDERLARVLQHIDVCTSPDADVQLRPSSESAADRAKRMIRDAQAGRTVVRVVRGDPLTEALVGQEAALCVEAGCEVFIMPAVTRLSAVLTMAGICGQPEQMYFTDLGRRTPELHDLPGTGWEVVTCTARVLPDLSAKAQVAGRGADEPVAVIVGGGTLEQHIRTTTVAELADLATTHRIDRDAEVIVGFGSAGQVHPLLSGTQSRPLFGWRVLLPRTRESSGAMERRLALLGAAVQTVDTLAVEPPHRSQPMDRAIQQLVDGSYRWVVFASSLAVRTVFDKVREYGLDSRAFSGVRIAALSPMAGRLLSSWGLVPDLALPQGGRTSQLGHTAANLVAAFPAFDPASDPMDAVLVPRTDPAADWIGDGLRGLGWDVDEVAACRVVRAAPPPAQVRSDIKSGRFDAVIFTSSSAVRSLLGLAGKPGPQSVICAIGPATAATCQQFGLQAKVVAPHPGSGELVDALAHYASRWRTEWAQVDEQVSHPSQVRGVKAA